MIYCFGDTANRNDCCNTAEKENMNEFYLSYKESKTAFADYQQKVLGNIINRTKPNGRDKFFCFPNYMDYYVLLFMFTNLLV